MIYYYTRHKPSLPINETKILLLVQQVLSLSCKFNRSMSDYFSGVRLSSKVVFDLKSFRVVPERNDHLRVVLRPVDTDCVVVKTSFNYHMIYHYLVKERSVIIILCLRVSVPSRILLSFSICNCTSKNIIDLITSTTIFTHNSSVHNNNGTLYGFS